MKAGRRSPRSARASIALLAALSPFIVQAAAPNLQLGDYEVRVFEHYDYQGQFAHYALTPDMPYLMVPQVPANLNDKISSVAMGPKVGVVLFADPGFKGKEENIIGEDCNAYIGVRSESYQIFRESTPRIGRVVEDWNPFDKDVSEGMGDRASSLLVFRKDHGGLFAAMLTNVRRKPEMTDALRGGTCEILHHFYPISPMEEPRCYDVDPGLYEDWVLTHGFSSPGYQIIVELFDQPGCQGLSIRFPDKVNPQSGYRLRDYQWEGRPRSIRVSVGSTVGGAIPAGWNEPGGRRQGEAFQSFWSVAPDAAECRARCDSDALCRSYSHAGFGVSGNAKQSLCELNRDEPVITRPGAGYTSGLKRFKDVVQRQTFSQPTYGGEPLGWCLGQVGDCGQPVASFYCQAQGFKTAENFEKDSFNNFGSIACSNNVTVADPLLPAVVAPAGSPAQPAGPEPVLARCDSYARNAVFQQDANIELGCNLAPAPVWSLDYQAHYRWCETASDADLESGTRMRQDALDACRASKQPASPPPADRCSAYATSAVDQQRRNLDLGCGYGGPVWSSEFRAHYQWCQQVDQSLADAGALFREAELQRCAASKGSP
jgi:hypothetical protein